MPNDLPVALPQEDHNAAMLRALGGAGQWAYDKVLPDYLKPLQTPQGPLPEAGKVPPTQRAPGEAAVKGAIDVASMLAGGAPKALPAALYLLPMKRVPGSFDIINDAGKKVAESFMHYQPVKKNVYIDFIDANIGPHAQAFDPAMENSIGAKEMRSLFSSIADEFPDALTASGKRIGGARAKQGNMNTVATFKLPRKE